MCGISGFVDFGGHHRGEARTGRSKVYLCDVRIQSPFQGLSRARGVERAVRSFTLDGAKLPDGAVPLADGGRTHGVRVLMG